MRHILARLILISLVVGCQSAPKLSAWKKLKKSFSGSSSASSSRHEELEDPWSGRHPQLLPGEEPRREPREEPHEDLDPLDFFKVGENILYQAHAHMDSMDTDIVTKFMELKELATQESQSSLECTIDQVFKLKNARDALRQNVAGGMDTLPRIVDKLHKKFFEYCPENLERQILAYGLENGSNEYWTGIYNRLGTLDELLMEFGMSFHPPVPKVRRADLTDLQWPIMQIGNWEKNYKKRAGFRVRDKRLLVKEFVNANCGQINQEEYLADLFNRAVAITRYNIEFIEDIELRPLEHQDVLAHYVLCERIRQAFANNHVTYLPN